MTPDPKPLPSSTSSSAALPASFAVAPPIEQGEAFSSMDDETARHFAERVVGWQMRRSKVVWWFALAVCGLGIVDAYPMVGSVFRDGGGPVEVEFVFAIIHGSGLGLLYGWPWIGLVWMLGNAVIRRLVIDELRSLGYDKRTARLAARAWRKSTKTFLPRIGRVAKEREVLRQLEKLRSKELRPH